MNSETKILEKSIPKNMVYVVRSGNIFRFREKDIETRKFELDTDLIIDSPENGMGIKQINDLWYWVCDCPTCLGIDESYPYSVCDKHNVCDTCGINRSKLKGVAWGIRKAGFRCNTCEEKRRKEAIEEYKLKELCPEQYSVEIVCPYCGSVDGGHDLNESDDDYECGNCCSYFSVEVEYEKTFSMSITK